MTLTTQTPVINADVTAATTVYYTPYIGLLSTIFNGTIFVPLSIVSELSLGLVAAHAASQIYDLYLFLVSGVVTLGSGPSWAAGSGGSVTAGSCARGTGAGGAALSRLNGTLTNAVNMTMTYGPSGTTTLISANKATYVGSMFMDATNGQVTSHLSWGQNRKCGLWNAYNRVNIALQSGDSSTNWTYTTNTIRAANAAPPSYTATEFNVGSGATCNSIIVFSVLAEENNTLNYSQVAQMTFSESGDCFSFGFGFNSNRAIIGTKGSFDFSNSASTITTTVSSFANLNEPPLVGHQQCCGFGSSGWRRWIGIGHAAKHALTGTMERVKMTNVNSFKTSPNGRKFIEQFEGIFLHTYDDGTGVMTIGYGHTTPAGPPKVIPGMTITSAPG